MPTQKKTAADLLFWSNIVIGVVYGAGQFIRMLSSTQGVSTSMFLFKEILLVANLYLAIRAHSAQSSRLTTQIIVIGALGVAIYTAFLGLVVVKGQGIWDNRDNLTLILTLIGITGTLAVANGQKLGFRDPIVKGWVLLFLQAVPQLVMAYKIHEVGGKGVSAIMVATFHILTLQRIFQILLSIKEAGWDRNRKGIAINEIGNEIAWIIVTIVWFVS